MQRVRQMSMRKRQILSFGTNYYEIRLKERVLSKMQDYHNSQKVINKKKAFKFRKLHLLAPCFVAFKSISYRKKMHNDITAITNQRITHYYFKYWI